MTSEGKSIQITRRRVLATLLASLLLSSICVMFATGHLAKIDESVPQIRVACVGDSITQGSGYPTLLQTMLGNNYTVKNFGESGSAVTQNSAKPYMDQMVFLKALDFNPDLVVIMLGTNDANEKNYQNIENFSSDYERLISRFSKLPGEQQIWLVEPPPILENNLNLSDTNLVNGVIPQIEQVATNLSLPTIDMHTAMLDYGEYFGDGVHPGIEAANLIASGIENAITIGID